MKDKGDEASEKIGGSDEGRKSKEDMKERGNKGGNELTGNYRSGDDDGRSAVRGQRREKEEMREVMV